MEEPSFQKMTINEKFKIKKSSEGRKPQSGKKGHLILVLVKSPYLRGIRENDRTLTSI